MRVLIVDDHEVVREGLRATLGDVQWLTIADTAETGGAALKLVRSGLFDTALIDFRLPDMNGDTLCRELRKTCPSLAVVILSTYLNEDTVRHALQAGASAYVTKAAGVPRLVEALDQLRRSSAGTATSAPVVVKDLSRFDVPRDGVLRVTRQQERILELTAEGLTNEAIGARLVISASTVRYHLRGLSKRLEARSRSELVAKAIRLGLIAPHDEDVLDPFDQ